MSQDDLLLDRQLCFPLYACARKVTGVYTPYFRKLGLTYTQYIVLLVLWEHDDVSVNDLGRRLHLDSGTLTPVLKKMATKGWITRSRCTRDERRVHLRLPPEGQALRDEVKDIPQAVGACLPLSEGEAKELHRLLHKILDSPAETGAVTSAV